MKIIVICLLFVVIGDLVGLPVERDIPLINGLLGRTRRRPFPDKLLDIGGSFNLGLGGYFDASLGAGVSSNHGYGSRGGYGEGYGGGRGISYNSGHSIQETHHESRNRYRDSYNEGYNSPQTGYNYSQGNHSGESVDRVYRYEHKSPTTFDIFFKK